MPRERRVAGNGCGEHPEQRENFCGPELDHACGLEWLHTTTTQTSAAPTAVPAAPIKTREANDRSPCARPEAVSPLNAEDAS